MQNLFTIIDELLVGLSELKASLQRLAAFSAGVSDRSPQRQQRRSRSRGRSRASTKTTRAEASSKPRKPASRKPRKPVSPKLRAQRVQQGKYLAALRGLSVQQRAQVKKAKAEGDYGAALKLAASLGKKSA